MAAVRHDLAAFARQELPHREALGYPPFTAMVRIVVRGPIASAARGLAEEIARRLKAHGERSESTVPAVRILGPATAPIAKLRGNFRYQIQLQSPDIEHLRSLVRAATADLKSPEGVVWTVDVDPLDMM
jgi:primosomal protein N' (replication factor Y)